MRQYTTSILGTLLIALAPTMAAADQQDPSANSGKFSLGGNVNYSTGKYGGSSATDILYVPLSAGYATGQYLFNVTIPYISVTTSDHAVVPGIGRMSSSTAMGSSTGGTGMGMGGMGFGSGSTTAAGTTTTESGLGDITASLGYNFYAGEQLGLTVVGGVKLGTADYNKGLGTGKNDYSAEVDSAYAVDDTSFLATLGYRVVGKPAGFTLNNVAYGSAGISQKVSDDTRASLILNGAQSSNAFSASQLAISAGWLQQINATTSWSASLAKGLSSGSPDWGGLLGIFSGF